MPNGFVIPFASCLARVCDFIFCSFFSCLVCSVLPYLCLWVKFSGFWLAKFLHLPWHIGIFVILQGGEFNEIRSTTMTTTFASNLNLM